MVLLIPSQSVFSCSSLPSQDLLPFLEKVPFEYIQGLFLIYEADQGEYLFDSLGAKKIIESKILRMLQPYIETNNDAVAWKIFADATNASGTTSAPSLQITLESQ